MTENEAIKWLKEMQNPMISEAELYCAETCYGLGKMVYPEPEDYVFEAAIQALEEIQQYREYKEIFESHFSKEALELLSDKEEFGKWLKRGKWIAKKCDEINRKLESFEAIGTIEEFKALKEKNEPYKPKEYEDRYYACKCDNILLPKWKKYPTILMPKSEGLPHCMACGQKLDWSE